jgi:methionine-rich copper-binding protein CopC
LSQYATANPTVDHVHLGLILNIKELRNGVYGLNWNIVSYDQNLNFGNFSRYWLLLAMTLAMHGDDIGYVWSALTTFG